MRKGKVNDVKLSDIPDWEGFSEEERVRSYGQDCADMLGKPYYLKSIGKWFRPGERGRVFDN